jgi:hypothetical protein
MPHRFQKHYTLEEARTLLPQIQIWLKGLVDLRKEMGELERQLAPFLTEGRDTGGPVVHQWLQALVLIRAILREFQIREVLIKDLDRGLIDFPSLRDDREVSLCWE